MKKALALVLALLLCVALPAMADNEDLLARIYNANTGAALQAAHESRIVHESMKDEEDSALYTGKYYEVQDSPGYLGGIRVRSSEYDYVLLTDGSFKRFITLDMEHDPWQFYTEALFDMELISAEEEDDSLVVTVKMPENEAIDYYPEAVETREVHVVDAKTLELKSYKAVAVLPDGSEEVYYEATVEYDVEQFHPETIEAIEKHLYEEEFDTRTTTFIFDEDKPCKRTYVFETPVGDGCILSSFVERGYEYEMDAERGEASNEALDNDAVYYMNRIVPEE